MEIFLKVWLQKCIWWSVFLTHCFPHADRIQSWKKYGTHFLRKKAILLLNKKILNEKKELLVTLPLILFFRSKFTFKIHFETTPPLIPFFRQNMLVEVLSLPRTIIFPKKEISGSVVIIFKYRFRFGLEKTKEFV